MSEHWIFGANDNDWGGWGITIAYHVVAVYCFICGLRRGADLRDSIGRDRWMWWFVGGAVLLLGINKQLDLQTPLIEFGRVLTAANGWNVYRRAIQTWFVVSVACMAMGGGLWAGVHLRHWGRKYALLYAGLVLLSAYIVLRAASLHHAKDNTMESPPLHGVKLLVEATGIVCVGLSAFTTLRQN